MSGFSSLLKLVNSENPSSRQLTSSDIQFSDPVVEIGSSWNTKVVVEATPGSKYTGSVEICYTRSNLKELDPNNLNTIVSEFPFTPETILELLNCSRGTDFSIMDMERISIPVINMGDVTSVSLVMKSNSLAWVGNVDIPILYGLPSNTGLLHTLLNDVFPSNDYFNLS